MEAWTERFSKLAPWLAKELGAARVEIIGMGKLSGGAIQENWRLDVKCEGGARPGLQTWVLRTDAPSSISTSLGRPEEYAILKVAHAAGVKAPEPVALCTDGSVIGRPFCIMERGGGTAQPRQILQEAALLEFGPRLACQLGENLARLHRVTPPQASLHFLPVPEQPPALYRIAQYRANLDALPTGHPVLEYALNWLEDNAPPAQGPVLCHTDFRTGNYMVENGCLSVLLDWEFASWSDPDEDIGWLCTRCWRFGRDDNEVGGIAKLEPFLDGYEAKSGRRVDRGRLPYWQVMAELRWAVIALHQGERNNSGAETTLELALTGLMSAEMELNILNLIDEIEGGPHMTSRVMLGLLEAACKEFSVKILPNLSKEQRYTGAMLRRALEVLRVQTAQADQPPEATLAAYVSVDKLAAALRRRNQPVDTALEGALRLYVERKLEVSNPRFLDATRTAKKGGDQV